MSNKVFCIGFHKTGTTSMAVALRQLGYRVTGPNGVDDPDIGKNVMKMAHDLVKKYDAFQDNPWPIIFRELDEEYPNSRFILTIRDPNSWIKSQVRHFGTKETPMRRWIYGVGCPEGNEEVFLRRYNRHNEDVLRYFEGRQDDFVVMDFSKGHGWDVLCPFLGKSVPDVAFPHVNKAEDRGKKMPLTMRLRKRVDSIFLRIRSKI